MFYRRRESCESAGATLKERTVWADKRSLVKYAKGMSSGLTHLWLDVARHVGREAQGGHSALKGQAGECCDAAAGEDRTRLLLAVGGERFGRSVSEKG